MTFELPVEFKDRFQQVLDEQDTDFIKITWDEVNSADISILLDAFDSEEGKYVFDLFSPDLASFLELMDSNDGTDILYEIDVSDRNEVIRHISDEEKAFNLMEFLAYDEDVVGGLMAKELIKAKLNWSISQCIEEIRQQAENVQKLYSLYVMYNKENLLRKVGVKNLILAKSGVKVANVYDNRIISVETSTTKGEWASGFFITTTNDFLGLAVYFLIAHLLYTL